MALRHLHNCAVPGCQLLIPRNRLMCLLHWGMIPSNIRTEVNISWREREANPRDQMMIARHEAAKSIAIEAVRKRESANAQKP